METMEAKRAKNAALLAELNALLETQGRLVFARERYDPKQAEEFGVRLLDFFRREGLTLRAAIVDADNA